MVAIESVEVRPWGSFEVLLEEVGYKVKRLRVNPGHRLSLQAHRDRSEHWVVVRGVASVEVGAETRQAQVGDHVHVPAMTRHRIANAGCEEAVIIEVQQGDRLLEEDIVRYTDDYGRDDAAGGRAAGTGGGT